MVTMDNVEEYVELMFDFCIYTGIQRQMEAFRGDPSRTHSQLFIDPYSRPDLVQFLTQSYSRSSPDLVQL